MKHALTLALLIVAVVLFVIDGVRSRSLTPFGLAAFAGAFLVRELS